VQSLSESHDGPQFHRLADGIIHSSLLLIKTSLCIYTSFSLTVLLMDTYTRVAGYCE
jgi:hypothetical protein